METKYTIMNPDGTAWNGTIDWPREPGYARLRIFLEPTLRGELEQVSVLADFTGGDNFIPSDMFVNERGADVKLPRNEAATTLYRRASMLRMPTRDPEDLPFIFGTAVLFSRRVWF